LFFANTTESLFRGHIAPCLSKIGKKIARRRTPARENGREKASREIFLFSGAKVLAFYADIYVQWSK
jgi:hypothetical protein